MTRKEYRNAVCLGIELAWAKCLQLSEAAVEQDGEDPETNMAAICAGAMKKLCNVCLDDDELEEAKRKILPLIVYKPVVHKTERP